MKKEFFKQKSMILKISLIVSIFLFACHPKSQTRSNFKITGPYEIIQNNRDNTKEIETITSEMRIDQRGNGKRIRGSVYMLLKKPNQFRFDAMTQLGPVLVLTSDGNNFKLNDIKENHFYEGKACPENIGKFLGIHLNPEALYDLFLARSPLIKKENIILNDNGSLSLLHTKNNHVIEEFIYEAKTLNEKKHVFLLKKIIHFDQNQKEIRNIQYAKYKRVQLKNEDKQTYLPFRIQIIDYQHQLDTLLKVKSYRINRKLEDNLFKQISPQNTEELLCSDSFE